MQDNRSDLESIDKEKENLPGFTHEDIKHEVTHGNQLHKEIRIPSNLNTDSTKQSFPTTTSLGETDSFVFKRIPKKFLILNIVFGVLAIVLFVLFFVLISKKEVGIAIVLLIIGLLFLIAAVYLAIKSYQIAKSAQVSKREEMIDGIRIAT